MIYFTIYSDDTTSFTHKWNNLIVITNMNIAFL